MFFSSGGELLLVSGFIVLQLLWRWQMPTRSQKWLLLLGNLVLVSTVVNFATIGWHLVLASGIYALGKSLAVAKGNWRNNGITSAIAVLIGLFVFRNYPKLFGIASYALTSDPGSIIERLGISYILFRHIQFLVDAYRGKVKAFAWIDYLNFILFFPTFIAGPIDTYTNFKRWADRAHGRLKSALILPGVGCIFIGLLKKYALVPLIYDYAVSYAPFAESMGDRSALLLSMVCYSAYIFLDFSGYSDIAIGSGYLLGIRTPENFRSPYLALNLADFWRRWHMSFSQFLRELIFKPIVKGLSKRFPKWPRLSVSVLGYLLTFSICGIWHGSTFNFVLWGLWHGVGLALYKWWSTSRWFERYHTAMERRGWVVLDQTMALGFNFAFVTLGWLFFHYRGSQLLKAIQVLVS